MTLFNLKILFVVLVFVFNVSKICNGQHRLEVTIHPCGTTVACRDDVPEERQKSYDRVDHPEQSSESGGMSQATKTTPINSVSSANVLAELGTPNKFTPKPGLFTRTVITYRGILPISIKKTYGDYMLNGNIMFWGSTTEGHNYIKLSPLNNMYVSTEFINGLLQKNFAGQLFPFGTAKGKDGNEIKLDNVFDLTVMGETNQVKVTAVTQYTFTLSTTAEHVFKGSVTHGVIRDADGYLWIFQEGTGDPSESGMKKFENNVTAIHMWDRMAENTRAFLDKVPLPPNRRPR